MILLAFFVLLAACHKAAPPPKPPPEVGIITLRAQPVSIVTELPGRTVAYRIAEVRPQVNGVILKRLFIEGSQVKVGQQLYQIDPAPFQASYESAQASLARAQATATSTRLLAQRYKPLSEARAVSQQDYDNALASSEQAVADVAAAKAAVDTARINLAYTKVFAPISGRTGRSAVTEGALVGANQTTSLVVIQQLDPIYVDVTQASTVLLRLQREFADGLLKKVGDAQAEARLVLEDNTPYSQAGKLQFTEVTVDPGTGSVSLRAIFPNPNNTLLPGMFVRERLEEGVNEKGLLVPQRAVARNERGEPTVTVVGADNKAAARTLKTDRAIGDQWLVTDGVAPGDRIIVLGIQGVRPGAEVHPHEVTPEELSQPAVAAPKQS
ncbi:MAG TPA: efflux RND transporter periplasmic adaptor subunit [Steroidobacteraceae bacterium]|jgi:membrane fusion protein (multidrug efflux system)|nr:efflux RND transporter periplasmic adaptor subunit [Steroidobacteraceae bacterium]